jgi:hypothetical protein
LPPTPTWTVLYHDFLANPDYPSSCTGADCHDPGTHDGLDLSAPEIGYTTFSRFLVPGAPDESHVIVVLESGHMPQDKPQMPAPDVDLIRAWIAAGAPEN